MESSRKEHRKCLRDSASLDSEAYARLVSSVLKRRFAGVRHAPKLIARSIDTSQRNAENWLSGTHGPRAPELIRLMGECPELADAIFRLINKTREPGETECSNV